MEQDSDKAWSIVALGDAEPADRGDFYDALVEDEVKSNLSIFGGGDAKFYENPSPELKSGLKLASTYNPAFATVATYARGLVETIASARKNRAITDAHIGLETEPGEISLPLIEGTYVLFQPLSTTDTILNDRPRFDVDQLRIVTDKGTFDRNHLFLRVKKN